MKRKIKLFFDKQNLRRMINQTASYSEIIIAGIMLVGIILLSVRAFSGIVTIITTFFTEDSIPPVSEFLSIVFELVIGIEFIKMLVKRTPASAIEVLLYTIARKLVADHGSMLESLLGVVAIAILFATRKYLNDPEIYNHELEGDYIVNGGTSIQEVNKRLGADFDAAKGNTVAGYLFNYLKKEGVKPSYRLKTTIGDFVFEIYEMDDDLIRHIKITPLK
ncbi:transporter [Treponema phagedenis]|uniref:Transporter n=2 Tax=Treponema phagedenis TaxID=162 RepID=A0A0B7GXT0_TREPH|nr:transporter associated domain-containing protein [Treponema phagedenis]EFW38412.1 hypothetical protein HMPREF9554_01051 [Treponema phagedenis F0421]NVP25205.1 transporter [Treponema phagedenis]QEJ95933.1 transporter [Treponema phagedenis]QEJ97323.1 transporter [Treponema phagedenis]QEK00368.1 transporter [Treponema phagedenis]